VWVCRWIGREDDGLPGLAPCACGRQLDRRNDFSFPGPGRKAAPEFMALFRSAARRFRFVVWGAIAVLLSTGPVLLHQRNLSVLDPAGWPHVLWMKLGLVGALLLLTATHDLLLGPQVRKISALPEGAWSSWEQTIVRTSSWVPRVGLFLALGVLLAAVAFARS
jgi:copper resistance protein D